MAKKMTDKEILAKAAVKAKAEKALEAASKKAKTKPAKKAKVKIVKPYAKEPAELAPEGHNRPGFSQEVVDRLIRIEGLENDKKEITKAINSDVAFLKESYSLAKAVVRHELKMRKLDMATRAQFESGCKDLQDMTGYQMALNLELEADEQDDGGYIPANVDADHLDDMDAMGIA